MNTPDSEETWILLIDLALMGRGRGREGKNSLDLFPVLLFMKYISSLNKNLLVFQELIEEAHSIPCWTLSEL